APDCVAAVVAGIEQALEHDTNELEVVGDRAALPAGLAAHERVRVVGELDLAIARRWAVHAWTPSIADGELAEDAQLLETLGYLGVPGVLPAAAASALDGVFSPFVLVESPARADDWADALHHVLDNPGRRARRTSEALRRADAIDSPATAITVVQRFVGWATY